MFRAPLYPLSGAHDDSVGYHIDRLVLALLLVGSYSLRSGHSFICLHLTSNQQQLENQTVYVVTNAIVVSS